MRIDRRHAHSNAIRLTQFHHFELFFYDATETPIDSIESVELSISANGDVDGRCDIFDGHQATVINVYSRDVWKYKLIRD